MIAPTRTIAPTMSRGFLLRGFPLPSFSPSSLSPGSSLSSASSPSSGASSDSAIITPRSLLHGPAASLQTDEAVGLESHVGRGARDVSQELRSLRLGTHRQRDRID